MQKITLSNAYTNMVFSSTPDETVFPVVKLVDFDGWYSSSPVRADIASLPLSDGGFAPERTYRGPKVMTLTGVTYGGTAQDAIEQAWQKLAAISPDGSSMLMTVEDDSSIDKHMTVYLTGQPMVAPFRGNGARFQLQVTATDPRKYAPAQTILTKPTGTGGVDGLTFPLFASGFLDFGTFAPTGLFYLTNDGTAESWPIFSVRGQIAAPGFQILSSSQVIEYAGAVGNGEEVVMSPYAGGRATKGGVDVTSNLIRSDWPSIKPGETRLYVFNPVGIANANAQLTTTFSDAWW